MRTSMRCKLFVTDLDGTILVDNGAEGVSLPLRTRAALERLSAQGVTVCLASGRMHESIRIVSDAFEGPIISYNGAMVHLADHSMLSHHPVDVGVSDEVIEFAERHDLPLNFYSDGRILSRRFHPWWDLYEGRTCSPMVEVKSLLPYRGKVATKLLLMSDPMRIRALEMEFRPRFKGLAHVLISSDEYLEFMAPTVNKGEALGRLAGHLGVKKEEIVAAGDGTNDIEMLQGAGCAVAVMGGRQGVKDLAHHIVAGPEHAGVADFIEKNLLD